MALLTSVQISVSRTVNLGNFNNAKIEVTVNIGRDRDEDTPEGLRQAALDQAAELLDEAYKDFIPDRKKVHAADDDYAR